jgi:hypothetical protein
MPLAKWRQDVAPTVLAMAAEMWPEELMAHAVAAAHGTPGRADLAGQSITTE